MIVVHYLDNIRHFLAFAYEPYNFITNISAATIQFVTVVVGVKVFRKRAEAWLHRVAHKLLKPHLDAHLEAVKAHVTAELERVK